MQSYSYLRTPQSPTNMISNVNMRHPSRMSEQQGSVFVLPKDVDSRPRLHVYPAVRPFSLQLKIQTFCLWRYLRSCFVRTEGCCALLTGFTGLVSCYWSYRTCLTVFTTYQYKCHHPCCMSPLWLSSIVEICCDTSVVSLRKESEGL
jgi:hypothetical protein